jgi:hypothetical protein
MKASICFCALFFIIATLFPVEVSAQNQRFVLVSPRVGVVIDSLEATTYRLFRTIKNFHSASFYKAPDSTFWVVVRLKSAEWILRDSTFTISFEGLKAYAEKIDHWEELLQGTYQMGTSQPYILYDDGTPLNLPPAASTKTIVSPRQVPTDVLPLTPNTSELVRPIFETIHFDVAIGLMLSDLSELEQLTRSATNISVPLSFYVQVPLKEDASISFIGGWGFALGGGGGGNIYMFSSFLLYRPNTFSSLKPIVGLGAGTTIYGHHGDVDINAAQSYPILLFGLNIAANTLDILLTYPLTKGLSTTFESKSYTIKPAGFGLSLLLSL